METFSAASVARVGKKISEVDDALLHPASRSGLQVDKKRQVLQPGDSLWIDLPQGEMRFMKSVSSSRMQILRLMPN